MTGFLIALFILGVVCICIFGKKKQIVPMIISILVTVVSFVLVLCTIFLIQGIK